MASLTSNDSMFNTLLDQGKVFLGIQQDYKYLVDPQLQLIEETTSPQLGSIIENFSQKYHGQLEDLVNNKPGGPGQNPGTQAFQDLINKYNSVLKEYQAASETQLLLASSNKSTTAQIEKVKTLNSQLIGLLTSMDKMVTSQLVNKTVGYPTDTTTWTTGSGQEGVGDRPRLIAARKSLNNQNTKLLAERARYDKQVDILNTLMGEDIDGKVRTRSAYYHFLVWSIVSVTVLAYTAKYAFSV